MSVIREWLRRWGHGHVAPSWRKFDCGGPAFCDQCAYEAQMLAWTRGDET